MAPPAITPEMAMATDKAGAVPQTGTRAPAAFGLEVAALSAATEADELSLAETLADELEAGAEVAAAPLATELLAELEPETEAEVELSPVPIPPPIPGRPLISISSARSPHRSSRAILISDDEAHGH